MPVWYFSIFHIALYFYYFVLVLFYSSQLNFLKYVTVLTLQSLNQPCSESQKDEVVRGHHLVGRREPGLQVPGRERALNKAAFVLSRPPPFFCSSWFSLLSSSVYLTD